LCLNRAGWNQTNGACVRACVRVSAWLQGRAGSRPQWGWTGGLALAAVAAIVVGIWTLVPHPFGRQEAGDGAMLANAGELERNIYVQAHRQFVGSNPIGQISLDVGFTQ